MSQMLHTRLVPVEDRHLFPHTLVDFQTDFTERLRPMTLADKLFFAYYRVPYLESIFLRCACVGRFQFDVFVVEPHGYAVQFQSPSPYDAFKWTGPGVEQQAFYDCVQAYLRAHVPPSTQVKPSSYSAIVSGGGSNARNAPMMALPYVDGGLVDKKKASAVPVAPPSASSSKKSRGRPRKETAVEAIHAQPVDATLRALADSLNRMLKRAFKLEVVYSEDAETLGGELAEVRTIAVSPMSLGLQRVLIGGRNVFRLTLRSTAPPYLRDAPVHLHFLDDKTCSQCLQDVLHGNLDIY